MLSEKNVRVAHHFILLILVRHVYHFRAWKYLLSDYVISHYTINTLEMSHRW